MSPIPYSPTHTNDRCNNAKGGTSQFHCLQMASFPRCEIGEKAGRLWSSSRRNRKGAEVKERVTRLSTSSCALLRTLMLIMLVIALGSTDRLHSQVTVGDLYGPYFGQEPPGITYQLLRK